MKLYLLAVVVGTFGLALAEVDWLVKNKHASYASKNGKTALSMDAEQVELIIKDKREYDRRWR